MKSRVRSRDRGVGLIIIILVTAFLLAVGVALLTVTGTGNVIARNVRLQQQAFNAAEAGFNAVWKDVEEKIETLQEWASFDGHYLEGPTGIDIKTDNNYFRKKTNEEMLSLLDQNNDGTSNYTNVLAFKQRYIVKPGGGLESSTTYTAFLINDEASGGTVDHSDALLVCIGAVKSGSKLVTSRLEIELQIEM
jgi:hypothetical protein